MTSKQKLELTWIGKDKAIKVEPRILIHDPSKDYGDKNTDNMLIYGDNLLALKALEQEYAGKVKCIYIDPPYNTGSAFEHYDDNLEHSTWLSLMKPRLEILRNLLADDGVIFVQIDDNEQAYLKVLCDEIFGRKNFICNFIWQKKTGASDAKNIAVITEYILCYAKKEKPHLFAFNKASFDHKRYRLTDEFEPSRGRYYIDNLDRGGLQYSDSLNYGITCPDGTVTFPNGRKNKTNEGWIWKWSKKKIEWALENKFLEFRKSSTKESGWAVCYKNYLKVDNENKPIERAAPYKNLILDVLNNDANKETKSLFGSNKFDYPKPELLIHHFINTTTAVGDLVLDSFLGSGTTAAVAHKMGRKYIGIELGEHCHTHCIPRLQKVIDGTDQGGISKTIGWKGGGGFKYYYLAPSLLNKDKYGQYVISKEYNADMLAAAMAKHEGFLYAPDQDQFWKQGKSSENDYIYTTTNHVGSDVLAAISGEMKDNESLLICCKSFDTGVANGYGNITIKKIPGAILGSCEFGKANYNLNIVNPPVIEEEE